MCSSDLSSATGPTADDALTAGGCVPGEAALDEETVDELRDLGPEALTQLYRQYLETLADTVAAIALAAEAPSWAHDDDGSVPRLAHRLKGSSSALGALRLAEVCQRLESGADGTCPVDLRTDLDDLALERTRVEAAVAELLRSVDEGVAAGDRT